MARARRSFAQPVRYLIVVATSISVLILGVAWAGTPVPVVDTPRALEQNSAASQGYFAWARVSAHNADAFVKPDGAPKIRMNRPNTDSFAVAIDDTTAVYDVFAESVGNVNLKMFDVLTQTRSNPPTGVNTSQHEYRPSISGDWLLFTRDNFRPALEDTFRRPRDPVQHLDERATRARESPRPESLSEQ